MSRHPTTIRAMPRPRTGTIIRNQTRLGTSYGLRFSYRGEKIYHHVGGSWEGWTEERVEAERVHVMGQVQRGEYVPRQPAAALRPRSGRAADVPSVRVDRPCPQEATRGGEDL